MGNCPFAPYLHEGGKDLHPSFGIFEGQQSNFNCFSCGKAGRLTYLPFLLSRYTGSFNHFINKFIQANDYCPHLPPKPSGVGLEDNPELHERLLSFKLPEPKMGLYDNQKNIELWQLRYDPEEKALVFPIFDEDSNLVALKGRPVGRKKFFQYTEAPVKQAGIWYGMNINAKYRKVFLVEGERDAILLSYKGISAWASMGSEVTKAQISTIRKAPHKFILFFDNDKAGRKLRDVINKECGVFSELYVVTNYCGLNDPAEIVAKGCLRAALQSIRKMS